MSTKTSSPNLNRKRNNVGKLYFRYGTMNSAKTANLMMVAHSYITQGKSIIILTPGADTRRDSQHRLHSRAINDDIRCEVVAPTEAIEDFINDFIQGQDGVLDAIFVDEAQFFTKEQIRSLAVLSDTLDVPVLCYGLRCSYKDGELFEGSAALMYWADNLEEVKSVCEYCGKKATKNLLRINGAPQYSGDTIIMGDIKGEEAVYTATCREHYLHPPR